MRKHNDDTGRKNSGLAEDDLYNSMMKRYSENGSISTKEELRQRGTCEERSGTQLNKYTERLEDQGLSIQLDQYKTENGWAPIDKEEKVPLWKQLIWAVMDRRKSKREIRNRVLVKCTSCGYNSRLMAHLLQGNRPRICLKCRKRTLRAQYPKLFKTS
ncbi:MAG: hypothetical protein GWN01_11975 [Nitrosopumilaceae archaeon]|nr:hypothetical protein [Nitrosopumilaceae archaeon]NIU01594.1 hypothetical protein [Nitrosopumilaceae archaeon]NIU88013.1 hypothetical protein [Nitrosopumilaceae archaeon]NIV66280.1 hypothetical protein [Nitrosopumilaceae archaeon]NIX62196.1 hypothetical protein [Nitrosopumilaceae archaeon]